MSPDKFRDPFVTAKGETRARVALRSLDTLWFNTGTLCNLTCGHCYIESSPRNDRLAWLSLADVRTFMDEIARDELPARLIRAMRQSCWLAMRVACRSRLHC